RNDGVLVNNVSFEPGMVGQAFRFHDASGDMVKIPRSPILDPGDQLTIEFWMKSDLDNPMTTQLQGLVTTDFYTIEIANGSNFWNGVAFGVTTNGTTLPPTPVTMAGTANIN